MVAAVRNCIVHGGDKHLENKVVLGYRSLRGNLYLVLVPMIGQAVIRIINYMPLHIVAEFIPALLGSRQCRNEP